MQFGVESVGDLAEVTDGDLLEMGMKPLHRRRVLHAAQSLSSAADGQVERQRDGGGEKDRETDRDTGRETDRETDDDAEEFVRVEEMQTDDEDDELDEDFHAMTNAIRSNSSNRSSSSAACGAPAQAQSDAPTRSKAALSLSPAHSQDATEDTSMERSGIESAATALVPTATKRTAKAASQRTSASQKESAARLTASAFAGRIASPNQAAGAQHQATQQTGAPHTKNVSRRRTSSTSSTQGSTRSRPPATRGARRSSESASVGSATLRHSEAEAKLLASDTVTAAKRKLRSMSYRSKAQDPRTLFRQYDRDKSGPSHCTFASPTHFFIQT